MTFRVVVQPGATQDLRTAAAWIARDSPIHAQEWLNGIEQAIASLSELPNRCPLAPEHDAFDVPIRQLMHGQYRVIFTVVTDANEVWVLHVRHGARRAMNADDIR